MDFVLDDDTPVVEQKDFVDQRDEDHGARPKKPQGRATILTHDSSSSGSEDAGADTASSASSFEDSRKLQQDSSNRKGGVPSDAAADGGGANNGTDSMSNSYHEIFDAQMPPEEARAAFLRGQDDEGDEVEDAVDAAVLPRDCTAADTTQYLTSKLVQDSIRWQQEHRRQQHHSPSSSPSRSPRKKRVLGAGGGGHPGRGDDDEEATLSRDLALRARLSPLDPTLLLDIENDARHLATSVDDLVENLSGVLRSVSALTVETVETYRDGVCKTCDEVDGNIKSMYQLMAKVEELNKAMAPAYRIGEQLKDLKKLLDLMESAASGSSKFKPS